MAKSRKKPGCLCPIITIAMAHPVARSGTTTEDPKRTSQIGFVSPTAFPPLSSPDKSGGARTAEILQCSLFIQPHSRSHVGLTIPPKRRPPASPARRCRHRATSYDEVQDSGDTRHPKTTHIYSMPTRSSVATHSPATAWRAFHRCRRSRWMALRCASGLISLNVALCSQVHGA